MGKKGSKSKQKRLEQEKLAQQKQQEKKKTTLLFIGLAAALLVVVAAIILVVQLTRPTNYVCLTVRYTDDNGQQHTGDIIVELIPEVAPITVKNFQKLVRRGFYDGLSFHRVIEGFMIQGGDPDGDGTGGSKKNIKGEFAENGVNNPLKHERGVLSMARTDAPNSASSQFFIVHKTSSQLDGKYAAFGRVLSGMEYVDGIAQMTTDANDTPLKDAIIVSAKFIKEP